MKHTVIPVYEIDPAHKVGNADGKGLHKNN